MNITNRKFSNFKTILFHVLKNVQQNTIFKKKSYRKSTDDVVTLKHHLETDKNINLQLPTLYIPCLRGFKNILQNFTIY
jgi:hypothetical protein